MLCIGSEAGANGWLSFGKAGTALELALRLHTDRTTLSMMLYLAALKAAVLSETGVLHAVCVRSARALA